MSRLRTTLLAMALAAPIGSAGAATIQVYFNDFDGNETHADGVTGGFGTTAQVVDTGSGLALSVPTASGAGAGGLPSLSLGGLPSHSGIVLGLKAPAGSPQPVCTASDASGKVITVTCTPGTDSAGAASEFQLTIATTSSDPEIVLEDGSGSGSSGDTGADPQDKQLIDQIEVSIDPTDPGDTGNTPNFEIASFVTDSVPEPAALLLLGAGLAGLGVIRRRKRS